MPFWQPVDVQRVCTNLREQGLILLASAPYSTCHQLKFAFNEQVAANVQRTHTQSASRARSPTPAFPPPGQPAASKNTIAGSWTPDKDTLTQLAQLCIPSEFAMAQVPEFVNYWRERGEPAHAWGSKFIQRVIRKWREFEAQEYQRSKTHPMDPNWRPSEDAMAVLVQHAGISHSYNVR